MHSRCATRQSASRWMAGLGFPRRSITHPQRPHAPTPPPARSASPAPHRADMGDDRLQTFPILYPILYLCEHDRTRAAHAGGVARHHLERGTDVRRKVGLVHDQQVQSRASTGPVRRWHGGGQGRLVPCRGLRSKVGQGPGTVSKDPPALPRRQPAHRLFPAQSRDPTKRKTQG